MKLARRCFSAETEGELTLGSSTAFAAGSVWRGNRAKQSNLSLIQIYPAVVKVLDDRALPYLLKRRFRNVGWYVQCRHVYRLFWSQKILRNYERKTCLFVFLIVP